MNNKLTQLSILASALLLFTSAARAEIVSVSINGSVEWNQITSGPMTAVHVGDAANLSFLLDSTNFSNNPQFPTRGYAIDKDSFSLRFPAMEVKLQTPYLAGTPYFVVRNNDPAVDGFFISTGTGSFAGVPTDQTGFVSNLANEFHATYPGTRLSSLDILGAVGHYDFTGLSVFNWTLDDGPTNPVGILYNDMTITVVPEPTSLALIGLVGAALTTRRRRSR